MKKPIILILLSALAVALLSGCASDSALKMQLDRKPKLGVIYGLKPKAEARTMEVTLGKERQAGWRFPESFQELAPVVAETIKTQWPLEEAFVVENRSEFKAGLVAGVHLEGWYEKSGSSYGLYMRTVVIFMNSTMSQPVGPLQGYRVAEVKTKGYPVPEVNSLLDRDMKHQALEKLFEVIPPEKWLPELKEKTAAGLTELIKKNKGGD